MGEKIVSLDKRKQKKPRRARKKAEELHARKLLECIGTIEKALSKSGEDKEILVFFFICLGMVITDDGFKDLLNTWQGKKGGRT